MTGVRLLTASKSSIASGTPASRAMASRCSTALVEPPVAATPAMALSNALRVTMSRGFSPFRTASMMICPQRKLTSFLRASSCGTAAVPMGESPISSITVAIVLAVNWPPHAPGAGAGMILDVQQFLIVDLARGMRAHGLEHVHDGDVAPLVPARQDRPAVQHDARHVQPQQRHGAAGNGLIARHQRHDAVEHVPARHQFDRIRDHLAAHQRRLHALGAHGHAVADGDGVELHRRAAGGANSLLHLHRQVPQFVIAGHRLDPGIGNADDRLLQILVGEADALQHGAGGRTVGPLGDGVTVKFHR